jgi:predicted O-linked N-acetylglucosamine transferase (SPINDLY family)
MEPNTTNVDALLEQGIALLQQGDLARAEVLFQRIVANDARHADANHLLGVVAMQRGQHDAAIRRIEQAIQANPGAAMYYNNLAYALNSTGRFKEALPTCEQALRLSPDFPEAHYNRGNALQGLGQAREALAAFERTIQLRPGHIDAHFAKGCALLAARRGRDAEHCFRRVIELNPRHAGAYNNLGVALLNSGRYDEALAACDRALQLVPDYAHAHLARGDVLKKLLRMDEALAAYERAIALQPGYTGAHGNRAEMMLGAGRVEEAEAGYRRALELNPADASQHSNLLFVQAAQCRLSFDEQLAALRRWDEVHGKAGRDAPLPARRIDAAPGRRLRVGYVSPHLRAHVVNFFFEPLLAAHDQARFEVYCYASMPEHRADDATRRLRGHAEHWRFVRDMSDAELARLIRADSIDILVDLDGHTAHNRLKAFTYRPAPIQATYLGFFASTGLAAMDYWITDAVLHPQDTAELASEKILRLPRCWVCYRPHELAPDVAPCPHADERVTLGSFSNVSKLTPEVIETWSRILRELPESRLLLMDRAMKDPMVRTRLLDRFAACGVTQERLWLRDGAPRAQYFATYAEVDIVLDAFPRTGGTTTAEALWMGVPVVTLAGQRYVERISASKLMALGLDELIARDREEYVAIALSLARDPARRAALRASLRDTMARSALCDGAGLARAMEAAYLSMVERHLAGSPQSKMSPQ